MKLDSKRSDRLPRKTLLRLGAAVALAAAAFGAQGAGLGRLNVLSSIGQPLRAEIELTAVTRDESVTAKLASPDAFAQANIDYGAALTTLRFSIQRRSNGTPYVLVTSSQLVNEPFLDVLVELSWSAGRLVREYTLLIDPPNTRDAQREVEPGAVIVQAQTPMRAPAARRAASPAAPPVPATSSPAARSSATVAAGASTGAYVVRSGDTAMSIARDNRPQGVSLEQMLAALYRDNPQAFTGNIDRLMAGATVSIPDASSAKAIDGGEARRIVAQSSNFGTYRERIARNAAQAPTSRTAGQQASGKLTTQVDDGTVPAGEIKDRLQLSRPDAGASSASNGTGVRSGAAGPSAGDLAAKDRELQETKTRLALLEKNVADLQQLLALKNQSLADLQKGGTPKSSDGVAAAPATAPAQVVAPLPVAATPLPVAAAPAPPPAVAAAESASVQPAPAPAPAPAKATPPPTTTVTEESWFDSVKDNTMLLIGLIAIIVLLVGYGLFTARRRRKLARFEDSIFVDNSVLHANSVFGTTGGQSVDTANSGFHSNFVPVAGNLPEQNEVDPVAEADVYIAYGRDAQAEEILKEALRADPNRHAVHLKLLEIYAKRGDAKTFETMASELYAVTGGQGEDWKQAAMLGLTIDPHNPLYTEVATPAPAVVAPRPQPSGNASSIGHAYGAAAGLTASDLALGDPSAYSEHPASVPIAVAEHTRTEPMARPEPLAATSAPSVDLDFDLGVANAGLAPLPPAASTTAATPSTAPGPRDSGLDFDVGGAVKPLIDPFTASAFGGGDSSARTAVNLPAFRARAEQESPARPDPDGFSASDIFGSSIVADTEVQYGDEPSASPPYPAPKPTPTPSQARTQDFRQVVDSHQFDKTEPLDAFSNINLDLDNGGYESTSVSPDFGTRTDVWQAMATKLDLALAYSDIGDREGARELLEEVVRNGDPAQAERARQLIGELG